MARVEEQQQGMSNGEWREMLARARARGDGSEEERTERKQKPITPKSVEPLSDVVSCSRPSNDEHGLVAVPLVRDWLFVPDSSRLRYREVQIQRRHKGNDLLQRIRIGDRYAAVGTGYGILKAQHQRLVFGIQDLWQKQGGKLARVDGRRSAIVCASSRDLESRLFRSHGGRQQRAIRALIQQVASIPVEIQNYIGSNGEICDLDITGLIVGATFSKTRRGGQRGTPWIEIYLSSVVTDAFEANDIKPVNLSILNGFRSDLSALLYPKIDYYLAFNSELEMRLDGLVEKMGLQGKQMRQSRYRLRKFEPVVEELDGRELSREDYMLDAKLVPAKGKDYKLVGVARRKRAKLLGRPR